jgi:hypothetical protein
VIASLSEVEEKLRHWLVRYYQSSPHAGLLGRDPATCFAEGEKGPSPSKSSVRR